MNLNERFVLRFRLVVTSAAAQSEANISMSYKINMQMVGGIH